MFQENSHVFYTMCKNHRYVHAHEHTLLHQRDPPSVDNHKCLDLILISHFYMKILIMVTLMQYFLSKWLVSPN